HFSTSPVFPYTTLFRSYLSFQHSLYIFIPISFYVVNLTQSIKLFKLQQWFHHYCNSSLIRLLFPTKSFLGINIPHTHVFKQTHQDRKSTRLNSSHVSIS